MEDGINLEDVESEITKTYVGLEPAARRVGAHQGADRAGAPLCTSYYSDLNISIHTKSLD